MSKSKAKGYRYEKKCEKWHNDRGISAQRMILSGSLGGDHAGDVHLQDLDLRVEVKARKSLRMLNITTLINWLGNEDLMFLYAERQEPYVFMPASTYEKLLCRT